MDHGAFGAFEIAASGMTAQRQRLDAIADNIANAQTTRTAEGGPFKRREITLAANPVATRFRLPDAAPARIRLARTEGQHVSQPRFLPGPSLFLEGGVVAEESRGEETRLVYEPGHPDADEKGLVAYPDISVVQEMVEMILASRAYEANVSAVQSSKAMFQSALEI